MTVLSSNSSYNCNVCNDDNMKLGLKSSARLLWEHLCITHSVFLPALSQYWSHLLVDHHLLHVLQWRMLAHLILKRQHVLIHRTLTKETGVHQEKAEVGQQHVVYVLNIVGPFRGGLTISSFAAWGEFPQNQTQSICVYPEEGVSMKVNSPLQDLWGHVPPGPHLVDTRGHNDTWVKTVGQTRGVVPTCLLRSSSK